MSRQSYLPLSIVQAFGRPFQPIRSSAFFFRPWSALPVARPIMLSADFRAAVRKPLDFLSSTLGTRRGSPGVSSVAFRAQLPDLRFASLMDMDFAISRPLVRRLRLISGSCPSTRTFAPRFLQTSPRDDRPCALLTLHLHQVGWRTFTSKLLNMPGTQLNRSRGRFLGESVREGAFEAGITGRLVLSQDHGVPNLM